MGKKAAGENERGDRIKAARTKAATLVAAGAEDKVEEAVSQVRDCAKVASVEDGLAAAKGAIEAAARVDGADLTSVKEAAIDAVETLAQDREVEGAAQEAADAVATAARTAATDLAETSDRGESSRHLSEVDLNKAFGFATILAALSGIKTTFAVEPKDLQWMPAVFLAYFLIFRLKMYLDDSGHEFEKGVWGFFDGAIALLSWVAFLVSAACVGTSVTLAIGWFIGGLLVSTIWIVFSIVKRNCRGEDVYWKRYAVFFFSNVVQIVGLWFAIDIDACVVALELPTFPWTLSVLTVLVAVDWYATARVQDRTSEGA